jgi:hypothetical protein
MDKKFQWSATFGGKMYVIRTDDQAEFDLLVAKYEKLADNKVNPPMNTDAERLQNFTKEYEADANKCPIHNAPMIEGKSKKPPYRPYSYHDENGQRCFGKGYLPPKS